MSLDFYLFGTWRLLNIQFFYLHWDIREYKMCWIWLEIKSCHRSNFRAIIQFTCTKIGVLRFIIHSIFLFTLILCWGQDVPNLNADSNIASRMPAIILFVGGFTALRLAYSALNIYWTCYCWETAVETGCVRFKYRFNRSLH